MGKLALVQLGIEAALPEKGLVVPLLNDVAVLHDEDHVRLPDGGQTVSYDEGGAALHHGIKGLLDPDLRPGIDGRRCLIQEQHGRQAQHDPGNAQQLLLALGERPAGFPDHRIVALGKPLDEAVGVGLLGGGHHLLHGCLRLAHGDVVPNGPSLQPSILEDHAHAVAQVGAGHIPGIDAI